MDLNDALRIHPGDRVALAGGGGKTSLMFRLAFESASRGWTVVAGGTTRFTLPKLGEHPPVVEIGPSADVAEAVARTLGGQRSLVVSGGRGNRGRLLPLAARQVDALIAMSSLDLVVLEADGSRNRPFKAPGDDEPVIPAGVTVVLSVVGLDALGARLDEQSTHRPERVTAITGAHLGDTLTSEIVARVLLDLRGGRKGVPPGARWVPVLNKADGDRLRRGGELVDALSAGGAAEIVLTSLISEPPFVELILKSGEAAAPFHAMDQPVAPTQDDAPPS